MADRDRVQQTLEELSRLGVLKLGPEDERLDQPMGVRNSALVARQARELANELEQIKPALQQAVEDRDKRRRDLATTAVADGDDVAAALLRQELHRELKAVGDPLVIKVKVLQAVEKGDKATVAALLETGGSVFALLPEAELGEVRQAWAAKMAPDKARELARVEAAVTEAQRVLRDVEARVRKVGGLEEDDPLTVMAGNLAPRRAEGTGKAAAAEGKGSLGTKPAA